MKKRYLILACILIVAFSCIGAPVLAAQEGAGTASAAPAEPAPSSTPGESSITALQIDNTHQYLNPDGTPKMDKSYNDGYLPAVANGGLSVVLPLVPLPGFNIQGSTIRATITPGDTSASPFVVENFDKTVSLQKHNVAGGAMDAYLVEYSFRLNPSRQNGTYPVVIRTNYTLADGTAATQDFTVYVTISDVPAPTPEPTPTPIPVEKPSSQPKIMISHYSISPQTVNAGDEFTVNATLKNTSKSKTMKNIMVTFKSQTTDLMSSGNTNSAFVDKIGPEKTADFSFKMTARPDAKAGPQKIDLAIAFEDNKATQLTAADEISVDIHQQIRLEHEPPKIPAQMNMGDTGTVSLSLINKGKGMLYNVSVALDIPGLKPDTSAYIGNMDSGAAKTADIYVSVAADANAPTGGFPEESMPGESGEAEAAPAPTPAATPVSAAGTAKPGPVKGNLVVTYEDEYGKQYEMKVPAQTELVSAPANNQEMPMEEEPEAPQTLPPWVWIAVAGGAAAIIAAVTIRVRKKSRRAAELSEGMDDDIN